MLPRIHTLDTSQIDPALRGVRAALMIEIDAARLAEVMFGGVGAPTIKL